jgi:hypothetical protein
VGVFVGREAELRTLVDSATAGHAGPAAVLVLGEPGSGKSRLLEEASNRLARSLSALDRRRPDRESDRAGPAWRGVRHADVRPAPPRLDFTDRERFDTLAPAMGQTFLIGDGKGRRFVVPANATRLYVGFADAAGYQGRPGWYANNAGHLNVVATGVVEGPGLALDQTPPQLVGAQNRTATVPRGKRNARVRFRVHAHLGYGLQGRAHSSDVLGRGPERQHTPSEVPGHSQTSSSLTEKVKGRMGSVA